MSTMQLVLTSSVLPHFLTRFTTLGRISELFTPNDWNYICITHKFFYFIYKIELLVDARQLQSASCMAIIRVIGYIIVSAV